MSLSTNLSKHLKQIRGVQTQGEFAKRLGISRPTLNRLENEYQNVTIKTLEQITKGLKCDVGDLFR